MVETAAPIGQCTVQQAQRLNFALRCSLCPDLDLSVVILTWNSADHIESCIHAILGDLAASPITFEILVTDNGSQDGTRAILNALAVKHKDVLWPVFLNYNVGTTVSRNVAFRSARGRFIATVDSDAYPLPGCFSTLLDRFTADPKLGMVVPMLAYLDGRYQKSTDILPTIPQKVCRLFFLRWVEASPPRLTGGNVE